MIHARIDTVEHRKIVGFETGTRAQFDRRHGGSPLWVFLDSYRVKYRADFQHFLKYPWNYRIDDYDNIYISEEPPVEQEEEIPIPPAGYVLLKGRDGFYMKGWDNQFLHGLDKDYAPPPDGQVYIIDTDNFYLRDPDGPYITESEE